MVDHAEQPRLCPDCYSAVLEVATQDSRPVVIRWCSHNGIQAFAFKRGATTIQSWELHGPLDEREVVNLFSERLAEMFADGQVGQRRSG